MSNFVPEKEYLRIICYTTLFKKTSAAEARIILVENYANHGLSETTCRDWFRRFKNIEFVVEVKERSVGPK
ncbi:hypothetical protein AVEN_207554-1, partial [Araneus ventricosus]